jgi:hypothetical protein
MKPPSYFDWAEGKQFEPYPLVPADFDDLPHLEHIVLEGHTVKIISPCKLEPKKHEKA